MLIWRAQLTYWRCSQAAGNPARLYSGTQSSSVHSNDCQPEYTHAERTRNISVSFGKMDEYVRHTICDCDTGVRGLAEHSI